MDNEKGAPSTDQTKPEETAAVESKESPKRALGLLEGLTLEIENFKGLILEEFGPHKILTPEERKRLGIARK